MAFRGDEWGNPVRGGKPSDNITMHRQAELNHPGDHGRYGRVNSDNYETNNNFQSSSPPPAYGNPPLAYGDTRARDPLAYGDPARDPNMARGHHRETYASPWYRKKRTWAAAALIILLVIIVPVAVVVSRNKKHANAYPDYTTLNYTLLETCELPG